MIKDSIPKTEIQTANQLKEVLVEEYNKLADKIYVVANILLLQGKNDITRKLLLGKIQIDTMIMAENYYLTNLDIQLFAKYFNLPVILISSTKLIENNRPILIVNNTNSGSFYFIKNPGIKIDTIPKYRLFVTDKGLQLEVSKLAFNLQNDIRISKEFNLDEYIKNFKVAEKKAPPKLKIVEKLEEREDTGVGIPPTKEVVISPTDEAELLKQLEEDEEDEEEKLDIPLIQRHKSI